MLWLGAYWLAAALVTGMAALLTIQAWEHRRHARSRVENPNRKPPRGRILLLIPCKGADADLEDNLRPLFEQDYENYELRFAVESLDDNACRPIRRLIAQYPGRQVQLIVAGAATTSGQKVHNLLAATANLRPEIEILAFVDADVRPPRDWLRMLTQRLSHCGAATGYRWFVPNRPTWANCLLASMDCAVAVIMSPGLHHYVWGGSWAIRRDVFEIGRLREAWEGTLSDDLVAAQVLARMRQTVSFEPACIVPSPLDLNFSAMWSFVRRQFTIGRFYSPALWLGTLLLMCLGQAVFWGSLTAATWGLSQRAAWTWQPLCVVGLQYALHVFRAWLRQRASRYYLPHRQQELAAARRFDIWLGPLAAFASCCGLLSSAIGKRIVWKGISYEMQYGGQIGKITVSDRRAWTLTDVDAIESAAEEAA